MTGVNVSVWIGLNDIKVGKSILILDCISIAFIYFAVIESPLSSMNLFRTTVLNHSLVD